MKVKVLLPIEVDALVMNVCANVRFVEDAEINVNGSWDWDDANNPQMPCLERKKNGWDWKPLICLESGKILNWTLGVEARLSYKVCDEFSCTIENNTSVVHRYEGYVPDFFGITDENYGDYIYIDIDENGHIKNWRFTENEFEQLK